MSEDSSAKYYQDNKKTRKKGCERYQNPSKEEKGKNVTVWLRKIEKSTWRWKAKTCWVQ